MVVKEASEEVILKPKRPTSAYLYFNSLYSKELRLQHPKEKSLAFFAPLVKLKWDSMTIEEKKPFQDKADDDKMRFYNESIEMSGNGFFTLKDGSKSIDAKNIPQKTNKLTKSTLEKPKEPKRAIVKTIKR